MNNKISQDACRLLKINEIDNRWKPIADDLSECLDKRAQFKGKLQRRFVMTKEKIRQEFSEWQNQCNQ